MAQYEEKVILKRKIALLFGMIGGLFIIQNSSAQILFSDNFNRPNGPPGTEWVIKEDTWVIENNCLKGTSPSVLEAEIFANSAGWDNYKIEFQYKEQDCGVFFRYTGTNFYLLDMQTVLHLRRIEGGSVAWDKYSSPPRYEWNDVSIEVNNLNIIIFHNGTKVFDFTDTGSSVLNGKIGFRIIHGGLTSHFDNVVVTGIASTQYTLTMQVNPSGGGTTTPAVGTHTYDENTVVNISATPASGYSFVNWTGAVADANSQSTTVTMDANKTVTANFVGIPDIAVSPTIKDYGNVIVETGVSQTFTVTNEGTTDLSVTSTTIVGSSDFSITSGGGSFMLAPSAIQNIDVLFSPSSFGEKNATLRFESNDPDENPFDVSLTGRGVSHQTLPPILIHCFPPDSALAIPRNTSIQLRIIPQENGYEVDDTSIEFSVNDTAVVTGGAPLPNRFVTITKNDTGYTMHYEPSYLFGRGQHGHGERPVSGSCLPPKPFGQHLCFHHRIFDHPYH